MTTIRTVFFDFGGVLLRFRDGVDHRALEARFALEERSLMRCLYVETRYVDYQKGACTEKEWRDSILAASVKEWGKDRATEILAAYEAAERPLNPDMMALVGRLRGAGYQTGIISNTTPGMEARLQESLPHLIPMFDVRIGSGDLGIAKPDAGIFQHALSEAAVEPNQAVFTDDVRSYAQAARDIGMHGFHFTGYEQFASDLRSIGVDV